MQLEDLSTLSVFLTDSMFLFSFSIIAPFFALHAYSVLILLIVLFFNKSSLVCPSRSTLHPSPRCSFSWEPDLCRYYQQKEVSGFILLLPPCKVSLGRPCPSTKTIAPLKMTHSHDFPLPTSYFPSNLGLVIAPLPPRVGSSTIPVVPLHLALHICN